MEIPQIYTNFLFATPSLSFGNLKSQVVSEKEEDKIILNM